MQAVETQDGSYSLIHPLRGEWFHSKDGAKTEAKSLYIRSSTYLDALRKPEDIHVLDVGLGLGYNACSTIESWMAAKNPPNLHITSLEHDENLVNELQSGKAAWQVNWNTNWLDWCKTLKASHENQTSEMTWNIITGAGEKTIHHTLGGWNFIWQDPFSPANGLELWSHDWFKTLATQAASNCQLMTYSVSRIVKDNLTSAGWHYTRIPTTTQKRHWLEAKLNTI